MAGKNFNSTSKLTEFAPLSPEDKQSGVSNFIAKFFKGNKTETKERSASVSVGSERKIPSSQERLVESTSPAVGLAAEGQSPVLSERPFDGNIREGRSQVLKRLSNLVASKSVGYGETDLKQYWMPDSSSNECYECSERFTTFRRRHHCRICGQIFCFNCCSREVPGKILGCTGDLRVCTYCWDVVHSYLQSGDMRLDSSYDQLLKNAATKNLDKKEDDRLGVNCQPSNSYTSSLRRKTSVGYQEERFALGRGQPISKMLPEENRTWILYGLCQQLTIPGKGLPLQTVRVRLRVHQNVFTGAQLVDWLIENGKAIDRTEAAVIGEALVEGRFLESVTDEGFSDSCALYRILKAEESSLNQSGSYDAAERSSVGQDGQEPSWVKEIPHRPHNSNANTDSESDCYLPDMDSYSSVRSSPSTYQLDVDLKGSTVHLRPSTLISPHSPSSSTVGEWVQQSAITASPSSELLSYALSRSSQRNSEKDPVPWHQISQLSSDNGDLQAYTALDKKYSQHEQILLNQLLNAEGLSQTWSEIAMPLIHQMSAVVHPDATNDSEETDIRHYIQFKKITGGARAECQIINGIAFTKNVAHRSMVTRLENPRILLLNCAIVYQRVEGKFLSLEPVMMQEQNYLRNVVARIEALQPDLILVSRNVSRIAQESLRLLGITLALNVKLSVLERIARCTQTQIIMSVDALIRHPQLGKCKKFYLRTFQTEQGGLKSLMFLEGCPYPQFGCSVLLRGGNQSELSRLKRVFRYMIFCRYHWRLEQSYLMDEFARPPSATSDNFFEEPNFDQSAPYSPTVSSELSDADNKKLTSERLGENIKDFPPATEILEIQTPRAVNKYGDQSTTSKIRRKNSGDQPDATKRATVESVSDFSDPLHQYLNCGEEANNVQVNNSQILSVAKIPYLNQFRKALDDTILSISPYLKFTVPFLETDQGRSCSLRQYFPVEVYWSRQFHEKDRSRSRVGTGIGCETLSFPCDSSSALKDAPKHEFMDMKITLPATSSEILEVLAHFRACGGRITIPHPIQPQYSHTVIPLQASTSDECHTDVLDPGNHLHLSVLFCSFSTFSQNAPAFCVNPWVVNMDFYGRNDISLGNFLERYCFRTTFECPSQSCSISMLQHVRRFVHYPGCVQVTLQLVDGAGSLPTNDHILMWSCCSLCSVVSPVTPMSPDTWALSFGKFLELRFYGDMYYLREEHVDKADQASLPCSHSLHHDFYQYFGYRNIVATFKYSPILVWEVSLPPECVKLDWETEQLTKVSEEITEIAVAGQEIFSQVLERILNSEDPGLRSQLQKDQAQFRAKVDDALVQNSMADSSHWKILWHLEDTVVDLLRLMIDAVANWNTRLKAVDDRSRAMKGSFNLNQDCAEEAINISQEENVGEKIQILDENVSSFDDLEVACETLTYHTNNIQPEKIQITGSLQKESLMPENSVNTTPSRQSSVADSEVDASHETTQSQQSKSVKTILSQFLPSGSILSPLVVPAKVQEVHIMPRSSASIPIAVQESQPSTIIAHALASNDYQRSLEEFVKNPPSDISSAGASIAPKKVHGMNERDRERDKEKDRDSLNGELLLSSDQRRGGVLSFLRGSANAVAKDSGNIEGVAYSTNLIAPANASSPDNSSSAGLVSAPANTQQNHTYIEVQFSDISTNFFCRIYYAEEFLKLRNLIWPRGEEAYIRSLAHCVDWAARGGKSGSTFCKSRDDRLVLKEMSRTELSHFLDRAPHFFSYMTDNFRSHKPTIVAKILGVYRIVFKNELTGTSSRSNLLVMENLFYGREVSHKFDLKGSIRNRLVNPGSEPREEIVLLDENLLKITRDSPLYVLPHTKSVLMQALKRDTEFLTSQSVMDYSLLVGLDQSKKELVVGIIDYMRPFTWDKRLENVLKKMAGQGKAPTIVHPEEYQNRFMAAMHSYFLTAPDRWYGFGKGFE